MSKHTGARPHLRSAYDEVELAALKTAAAARLTAGQTLLDVGLTAGVEPGTLPITSSRMSHLRDVLCAAYRMLGFEMAPKGDNVFRDLVLPRIIEPTSNRRVSRPDRNRRGLRVLCHSQTPRAHLCSTVLAPGTVLCMRRPGGIGSSVAGALDVSTLYFETDVARIP